MHIAARCPFAPVKPRGDTLYKNNRSRTHEKPRILRIFAGVRSGKKNTENYERYFNGLSEVLRRNLTNKRECKDLKIKL